MFLGTLIEMSVCLSERNRKEVNVNFSSVIKDQWLELKTSPY